MIGSFGINLIAPRREAVTPLFPAFDALELFQAVAADVSPLKLNRELHEPRESGIAKTGKHPLFVPIPVRVFGVVRGCFCLPKSLSRLTSVATALSSAARCGQSRPTTRSQIKRLLTSSPTIGLSNAFFLSCTVTSWGFNWSAALPLRRTRRARIRIRYCTPENGALLSIL